LKKKNCIAQLLLSVSYYSLSLLYRSNLIASLVDDLAYSYLTADVNKIIILKPIVWRQYLFTHRRF